MFSINIKISEIKTINHNKSNHIFIYDREPETVKSMIS
jgi:hypothetical protein